MDQWVLGENPQIFSQKSDFDALATDLQRQQTICTRVYLV